jgi:hypothetical protein
MKKMIDPPSGWKYGFPKEMPKDLKGKTFDEWLISEGYPKKEIDKMGDHFFCRSWVEEDGIPAHTD